MGASIIIAAAYIAFIVVAIFVFAKRSPLEAAVIALFVGWMFLPVTNYPAKAITAEGFSMEVVGTLLPSNLPLPRTLFVGVIVLLCVAWKAPAALMRLRPNRFDAAMALFCLSPFLAGSAGRITLGDAFAQSAFLFGTWGTTWLVGRSLLSAEEGRHSLLLAIAASGVVLAPVAILEGLAPAWLYAGIYGPHPFAATGLDRYFGFRPVGFFEDGNQYGMWVAMSAFASIALVMRRKPGSWIEIAMAAVTIPCALASQSVGAIVLALGGSAVIGTSKRVRQVGIIGSGMALALLGTAYLSGKVPLRSWALETSSGQAVAGILRASGRQSLGWRVQRDQLALGLIHKAPVTGYGTWDWWRPVKSHPWGLPLLIAGQFGILSLLLAGCAMLGGPFRQIWRGSHNALPFIAVLASADAWLNSAAYLPAILAAAAMAAPMRKRDRVRSRRSETDAPPLDASFEVRS